MQQKVQKVKEVCRNWTAESPIIGASLNPFLTWMNLKKCQPCAETRREKDSSEQKSEDDYFKDCPVFR